LLVGALEAIARLRRLTVGMIAAAFGAIVGFVSLYIGWISGGLTPATGKGWSVRLGDILFGFTSPWGAGISWGDMLAAVLRRSAMAEGLNGRPSSQFLWMLVLPFIIFGVVLLKGWRMRAVRPAIGRLISITMGFYTISALEIVAIYSRGGDVSFEERHLRAAGMLIFVCVLACLEYFPKRSIEALTVWALSILMSLYGIISIAGRERSMKRGMVDSYSRTLQDADPGAIEFARSAFAQEGRDSLFVIPSARLAIALPTGARILVNLGESESEDPIVPRTYIGRVAGKVYVILPTQILETDRASQELRAFVDYPIDAWEKHDFGNSTVLVQAGQRR
jgi:hypothetical protein